MFKSSVSASLVWLVRLLSLYSIHMHNTCASALFTLSVQEHVQIPLLNAPL